MSPVETCVHGVVVLLEERALEVPPSHVCCNSSATLLQGDIIMSQYGSLAESAADATADATVAHAIDAINAAAAANVADNATAKAAADGDVASAGPSASLDSRRPFEARKRTSWFSLITSDE